MAFDLDIWHAVSLVYLEFRGPQFMITGWKFFFGWTLECDIFLIVYWVTCAKAVCTASSKGFLMHISLCGAGLLTAVIHSARVCMLFCPCLYVSLAGLLKNYKWIFGISTPWYGEQLVRFLKRCGFKEKQNFASWKQCVVTVHHN